MPIRNCSFRRIDSFSPPRPILPIKIINPDNNKYFSSLIDKSFHYNYSFDIWVEQL